MVNYIQGILSLGKKDGYFYSERIEGFIYLDNGSLRETLENPFKQGDHSLGQMIRDYQEISLELKKGGKISEKDLDFICSAIGTEIIPGVNEGGIFLQPFEIKLNLEIINLKEGISTELKVFPEKKIYRASNVKLGHFGFNKKFGIRYDLTLKV